MGLVRTPSLERKPSQRDHAHIKAELHVLLAKFYWLLQALQATADHSTKDEYEVSVKLRSF
jgi:hypothetical protein